MGKLLRRLLNRETRLDQLLEQYDVPSFPDTIMKVLSRLRDPASSTSEIAHLLKMDPCAHVRVLATVNSAAFGLANRVSNVEHAATLLGRSRLEALVVSVAVRDALPVIQVPGFDVNQFWRYTCKRAAAARALAQLLHPNTQVESFAAGLLQDIAVPILVDCYGERYCAVYQQWLETEDARLDELECSVLGLDHAAVGERIARKWHLGDYLVRAIADHHSLEQASDSNISAHLASFVRPNAIDDGVGNLITQANEQLGIDTSGFETVLTSAMRDATENFKHLLR